MVRTQLWRIPIWVVTTVFGAWVADQYVPGFRIDGSLGTRLIVGGVIAAVSAGAGLAITLGLLLPISALMTIGATVRRRPARPEGGSRQAEIDPHPVAKALGGVAIFGLLTFVVTPLSCFLAVRAGRVVGMPVELIGGWPAYFTVGVVLYAVRVNLQSSVAPRFTDHRVRPWLAGRLAVLAAIVVLWCAVKPGHGVHMGSSTGRHLLLDVLVLAAMLEGLRFTVGDRWGAVAQAPFDILAMWVLAWCSGLLVDPLHFSGPWPLVITAVALTALTLPLRLLSPPPSRLEEVQNTRRHPRVGQR